MSSDEPHYRYYSAAAGDWEGRFSLGITNGAELWRSPLAPTDKLRVLSLVILSRLIGKPTLQTRVSLNESDNRRVIHQTRVSLWGVTLYRAIEFFGLEQDGRGLKISGQEWVWPLLWWPKEMEPGVGQIGPEG